jgi:predicted nucleic acid-binding protein
MRISWADTHALLDLLRGLLTVHPLAIETHDAGLRLAERYGFAIYDAMITASALHAGCEPLWSEDMHAARHDARRWITHRQSISGSIATAELR